MTCLQIAIRSFDAQTKMPRNDTSNSTSQVDVSLFTCLRMDFTLICIPWKNQLWKIQIIKILVGVLHEGPHIIECSKGASIRC